jgi:hypothetical protein
MVPDTILFKPFLEKLFFGVQNLNRNKTETRDNIL